MDGIQPARRARRISNAPKLLLRTLEEKNMVLRLLDGRWVRPASVCLIGAEANLADLTDVSVVARPYGPERADHWYDRCDGAARMNYSRVIPLVDFRRRR